MELTIILFLYITFNIINYSQCYLQTTEISQINERTENEIVLFTEYNETHLLGVSETTIYKISPFQTTNTSLNSSYTFNNSTNLIYLGDGSFALVCLNNAYVVVFNLKGQLIASYEENISVYVKNIQCGVTYYNKDLYIGFPLKNNSDLSYKYIVFTFNSNNLYEKKIISPKSGCSTNSQLNLKIVCFIQNNKFFMSIPICHYNGYICITNLDDTNNKCKPFSNLTLTGGFEKDENNYIVYGISSNKIYILNINGENISPSEVKLYNYSSTFSPYSISGLRHNSNLYILFDNKTNINIFVSNIDSNSYKQFIVSTFNPNVTNITFIKGFIFNNIFSYFNKSYVCHIWIESRHN